MENCSQTPYLQKNFIKKENFKTKSNKLIIDFYLFFYYNISVQETMNKKKKNEKGLAATNPFSHFFGNNEQEANCFFLKESQFLMKIKRKDCLSSH